MKKLLLSFLLGLISLFSFSQNGGQANENSVLRIDYVGYSNGNHVFKITNKQPCQVTSQYTVQSAPSIIDITLPGNGVYYVNVAGIVAVQEKVKAKTTSFCPGFTPDRAWVEVLSSTTSLPIKFVSVTAKRISTKLIELTFVSEEDQTIDHYNVKISYDGHMYKIVKVLFPNGIIGTKTYKTTIEQ